MKRLYLLGLLALVMLNGCETFSLPPLMTGESGHFTQEQWTEYGAVYEYDELRIHTEDLFIDQGWNSFYYVNQKLRILNRKGVEYGTVKIPRYSDKLMGFKVTLWDPAGNKVPLNMEALRKKYSQTGIIIVPKVEPGCQIGINLAFRKANLVYSHEHWFEKPIPVINGRFSLFYPADVKYATKVYGDVALAQQQRAGAYVGYVWDKKNVLPGKDVFKEQGAFNRDPYVMVRLENWSCGNSHYNAPDWKDLARQCKTYFLTPSTFTERSRIKKTTNNVILQKDTAFQKAESILEYVQDEITLIRPKRINYKAIDLKNVLRIKSGNRFEIAALLTEMFKAAGFSTRVYVTRPQNIGGFDPEFPTFSYLYSPLVAVDIDDKELIAYPYVSLMRLGEYPFEFHDLQALDIENGTIAYLPKSLQSGSQRKSLTSQTPDIWEDLQMWQFIYEGHYDMYMRKWMTGKKR
ncbi:MAG: DUF3857 and transglutaminase domain-containing protein [Bacteroidetes bacterium]|nr:DUF3857 and transglutaminase domain-containing protein [Bacteroidota bacterium]